MDVEAARRHMIEAARHLDHIAAMRDTMPGVMRTEFAGLTWQLDRVAANLAEPMHDHGDLHPTAAGADGRDDHAS